jgi:hypothetical protein
LVGLLCVTVRSGRLWYNRLSWYLVLCIEVRTPPCPAPVDEDYYHSIHRELLYVTITEVIAGSTVPFRLLCTVATAQSFVLDTGIYMLYLYTFADGRECPAMFQLCPEEATPQAFRMSSETQIAWRNPTIISVRFPPLPTTAKDHEAATSGDFRSIAGVQPPPRLCTRIAYISYHTYGRLPKVSAAAAGTTAVPFAGAHN